MPHFYLTRDMEADRLVELLERLKTKMDPAPSVTELLVLAVSRTLRDHPRLNGRYAGGELEVHDDVNVGVAVATDEGSWRQLSRRLIPSLCVSWFRGSKTW